MNRRDWLVTYDICDDRRLRKVFKLMLGHGEHVQLSVFRCYLTPHEISVLKGRLSEILHHGQDQVLFISLGRHPERRPRIFPLGRSYTPRNPNSRIV